MKVVFGQIFDKIIQLLFSNFDIWRHFGPQNDPILTILPKMTYFDQIYAFNDIFDQISIQPDGNNY